MTACELFYREIQKLPIEDHEPEKAKTQIRKRIRRLITIIFRMS